MPLRPLIPAQSVSSPPDNKISPGRVVEYEQHSKAILGMALVEKKGKWAVLNSVGAELDLPVDRLTLLPGKAPKECVDTASRVRFLDQVNARAGELQEQIDLEAVWELVLGETKELQVADAAEILFSSNELEEHLATRRALLADQVFFKRKKTAFEPRAPHIVEELKVKQRVEAEKRRRREELVDRAVERLRSGTGEFPAAIAQLERLAALGKSADDAKESIELIEMITARAGISINGRPEDRAFKLLIELGHFTPDQNLLPLKLGRPIEFSQEAVDEARRLAAEFASPSVEGREDLRGIPMVTIDGEETRDFDDALSCERMPNGGYRIGIHIADVASVITPGSILDDVAFRRATSVYCPDEQFSMLPTEVSEDVLSLVEGKDRSAVSFFIETSPSFEIVQRRVSRSVIRVSCRLTYDEADRLLYDEVPDHPYAEMLHMLWEAVSTSESERVSRGALQLNRRELNPRVHPGGRVTLEESTEDKPGRKLVSEMAILANETAAVFAKTHRLPLVFRGQEPPDADVDTACRDIPEGPAREYCKRSMLKRSTVSYEPMPHAGLGVEAYTQATSPIRRAVDLINQRQIVAMLTRNEPEYQPDKIVELLGRVDTGLDEAQLIQRGRTRYWLLKYLVQERIKELNATILKIDGPKPIAELDLLCSLVPYHPHGRLERSEASAKRLIGKVIRLKVETVDPRADLLVLREIE